MMLVKGYHVFHNWHKQACFEVDKDGKYSIGIIELKKIVSPYRMMNTSQKKKILSWYKGCI